MSPAELSIIERSIRAMSAAFEVAVDQVLAAGWPVDRMSMRRDSTRGICMQLMLDVAPELRTPWPVFEVLVTSDLDHPDGPRAWIVENWLPSIPIFKAAA